jgi:hypothetical protein
MEETYFVFAHSVTMTCRDDDPSFCLARAWDLGACGQDWVWSWADSDHVRISFKREADSLAFVSLGSVASQQGNRRSLTHA